METRTYKTRHRFRLGIGVIAALILAGCGPAALVIPEDTETPTATVVVVPGVTLAPIVNLNVSKNAALGSHLTDESGFTLYYYKNDTARTSHCIGDCLQTWPGVMTSGAPSASDPSIKGKLGCINRPNGGMQVTYNDMPLYYYSTDN